MPSHDDDPPRAGSQEPRRAALHAARRRSGFGLASALLHGIALAALALLVSPSPAPPPLEEAPVEMVFQPPVEEPVLLPGVVIAPMPEPLSPPPETVPAPAPVVEPQPILPAPIPLPPPELLPQEAPPPPPARPMPPEPMPAKPPLVPAPFPSPKPKPPSKPMAKAPALKPAPVVEAPIRSVPSNLIPTPRAPQAAPVTSPPIIAPLQAVPAVDPSWQASVAGWLASRKTYPEEARRRGEEGRVSVRFTVDRSGRVLEAGIVGGSGSERLDTAAVALLRQAPLPAFPSSMTQAHVTITTTIRYTLR